MSTANTGSVASKGMDDVKGGLPVTGEPKNQLVLIGQNLDHDRLRQQLNKCLGFPATQKGFERKN